jgi:hypothetical protein
VKINLSPGFINLTIYGLYREKSTRQQGSSPKQERKTFENESTGGFL